MPPRFFSNIFFTLASASAVFSLAFVTTGCKRSDSHDKPNIAVTSSYLGCAVKDILGENISVLQLSAPGMCPGHFDIRPSQVAQLRSCRLLLRFDFQKNLDSRIGGIDKLTIAEIRVPGGLGIPSSYLAACAQTTDALVAEGSLSRQAADVRLEKISQRMSQLESQTRQKLAAAGIKSLPVICSVHQEKFCRWLGLDVVAVFRAADIQSVSDLNNAVTAGEKSGVKLIIANLPEGRKVADALGNRLEVGVVVFGNFPAEGQKFDDLLNDNLRNLIKATWL